jgi:RNA polymerase sigma-70 factor (ECF subfamily)
VNREESSFADDALVEATRRGDVAAFEELVYRYEGRITAFVLRFCPNTSDAAEIVQDTFVRAYQGLHRFDASHRFASWLFTIARNRCTDHFRAAKPQGTELPTDLIGPESQIPGVSLARRETADGLWSVARKILPKAQFEALWLFYAEDMGIREIAKIMGLTQTHVKVLLFRARRALIQQESKSGAARERESVVPAVQLNKQQGWL